MTNEKNTEKIVENLLRNKGYCTNKNIVIEEQSSRDGKISDLLKNASKNGKGRGRPDFIITFKDRPNDIIVIECKASITQHESKNRENYKEYAKSYAVDGALWYASFLKNSYNVTAIAVSGENEREKKISTFLWLKKNYTYKAIQDKIFLNPSEQSRLVRQQQKPFTKNELIKKAIEYNKLLHKYAIPEAERCTLISAILVALQDKAFLQGYQYHENNKGLIDSLIQTCERVLEKNKLDNKKVEIIINKYAEFKHNISFSHAEVYNKKTKKKEVNTILRDFIKQISEDILPYINNSEFDILGRFYTQFIRYTGSDKKTGLVLTPVHITDFFCEVVELTKNDIVFDECCGTAGFLVSAMNYMLRKVGNNEVKRESIKKIQLLGIEKRADMFTHACSNMMMRGDGKSCILYGDCFDIENKDWIKERRPTKAFLNPPYQDSNADEQLEFIENALECLVQDGICVAICQMSVVVSSYKKVVEVRERLLQNHTLEAVFSMPSDLFYPIGVNTSILIFKAHTPHSDTNKSTFFGYFKNDGFVKRKGKGRIDEYGKWEGIKNEWLNLYKNRKSITGLSVMQKVKAQDEWCAEAYMETDYSTITKDDFISKIKKYMAFKIESL